MLGSKAKMATLFRELIDEGISKDRLDRIHTPIGLPINSHSPEEIAVSIAAEIIAVKNDDEIITRNNSSDTLSKLLTVGTGKSGGIAMFDRLIESDTAGAEFKSRRRYFLVSSVVVGALFVSAVVFSIYASEIGLGTDSYELTALLTPVQPPADAPEPPQPQHPQANKPEN